MKNDVAAALMALYHAYHQLNRVCWQNHLPECIIYFGRCRSSLGIAYGTMPRMIALNLPALKLTNDSFILGILAHEMTHIWQFNAGRRGGHGADFRNEMLRIGIDEKRGDGSLDSPFGYCIRQRRIFRQDILPLFRAIRGNAAHRREATDFYWVNRKQLFQ